MKDIHNIHDNTFKKAMSDIRVARDFFEEYLPESVRSLVNLNTLKLSKNTYVDEELNEFRSDVLYQVETHEKDIAFFYLLCEHQSSVDPLMAFRLLSYQVRIWADYLQQTGHKYLPLIYSIVFYHGKEPYNAPRSLSELIKAPPDIIQEILFKAFHLVDTHEIEDEALRKRKWVGILTFMMKHVYARDIWPFIQTVIEMLRKIEREEGAAIYTNTLLKYWLLAADTKKEPKLFIETIQQGLSVPIGGDLMSMAEQLIQQGIRQGIQQGMQQGIQQGMQHGEAHLLISMLKAKFKELPELYLQKIESADVETLNQWAINFVNARSLEEVFKS